MAHILVASCRNWHSFTQFMNLSVRRMPLTSFTGHFRRSAVDAVCCVPVLQRHGASCRQMNHICSCCALKRWQTFLTVDISLGSLRKISSSQTMCTHDEHDKGSETTTNSSDSFSEDDDTVSSDSAEDSVNVSHSQASSTDKAQPISDVDVDKELLRYDYEEFELMPEEPESIVQPVKESIPVELESK